MIQEAVADHEFGFAQLLNHYGHAMARIGRLEHEKAALQAQMGPINGASLVAELEGKIRGMERALKDKTNIITSLRLQVDILNAQLASAEEKAEVGTEEGNAHPLKRPRRSYRFWRRLQESLG